MTEIDDTILQRIRKVQGYLKSDNPNEAAVAAAKLTELLIKYNIDLEDVPAEQRKTDPFVNVASDTETNRLPDWRITLGISISKANLCKVIISGSHLQWLGRKSNVEVAQYIYETCARDLQNICDGLWYAIRDLLKDDDTFSIMHGKAWKAEFLKGAATGVRMKLEDETRVMRAENENVNALMVTNDRELSGYVHNQYPRLGHHQGVAARGGNAYGVGVQTGRNVSFRTGVGAGGNTSQRRLGKGF